MTMALRAFSILLLTFTGLSYFAGTAAAQTVPDDFATIQAAVDAAGNGATITIKKGTYNENVVIDNKPNITIIGKGKPVINGGIGTSFTIANTINAFVTGITVRNSVTRGIYVNNCSLVKFSKCVVSEIAGDGIGVDDTDGIVIESCTINSPTGNGISFSSGIGATTNNSTINKCKISLSGGDGINIRANAINISLLINNISVSGGDGIDIDVDSNGHTLTSNKCTKSSGDGFRIGGEDNIITSNKASSSTGFDLFDENGAPGFNDYSGNSFKNANIGI